MVDEGWFRCPRLREIARPTICGGAGLVPRCDPIGDTFTHSHQSDLVTLERQEVSKRGSQSSGILDFGVLQRTEIHRTTLIENQITISIGFIFKLLNKVAVTPGEQLPIQPTRIVTRCVVAVLAKFDRGAMQWAPVQTAVKTIDNGLGP